MKNNNLATWADRHQSDIKAIANGYRSLVERGLVLPMALSINVATDSTLAWGWYKYRALPAHPHPRNARRGYTHPNDLECTKLSHNPRGNPPILTRADVSGAQEWEINKHIVLPILRSLGYNGFGVGKTDFGTEWESIFAWNGDRSAGVLSSIDLTRGRVNPWAEYPDANLRTETEINPAYSSPLIHCGGAPERRRVKDVIWDEIASTDTYISEVVGA